MLCYMGNSSSSSLNFLNEVSNELSQTNKATAISDCQISDVHLSIGGSMKSGCSTSIENRCSADADASITSILEAAQKAWSKASTEQKAGIALALNTSKDNQDIRNIVKNKIEQACSADAVIKNYQTGYTLDISGDCDAPINLINTGNARANCAIDSLVQTIQSAEGESTTVQDTDIGNTISTILSGLMLPLAIVAVVVIIFILVTK